MMHRNHPSLILFVVVLLCRIHAFLTPPPQGPRNHLNLFGGGGDEELPSSSIHDIKGSFSNNDFVEDDDDNHNNHIASSCNSTSTEISSTPRGGSGSSSNNVVKGAQVTGAQVTSFWKSAFQKVQNKIGQVFKSKEQKQEEELMEQLKTMPVKSVAVPTSSVLPTDVVRVAVKRSGLIGNPLRTDRVQEIARNLKRWYNSKGYVLHTVTGATLKPESATAIITVEEPKISKAPVEITICKEMIVDEDTGELLTYRQFREKHAARKSFRYDRIDKSDLNTTFVPTQGRTSPAKIAKAMNLVPGKPFQWDNSRWQRISSSGIFSKILTAGPGRTKDGNVCLQVYATEPPPRHLEYGLGKSLYTGTWEGEIDFEHQNLFGGGESVGLTVRRGTTDAAPSVRIKYSDDKFGLEGGHDLEVFTDFIGDNDASAETKTSDEKSSDNASLDYDHDALFNRRGATFRLKNPIDPKYIRNSLASLNAERTSTRTGLHENLGSASLTLGPFRQRLPMEARSSVSTTVTGGTRLGQAEDEPAIFGYDLLPYSQVSATTRQVLPLVSISGNERKPLCLALQHVVTAATPNLPKHEAKAMGVSAQIRGVKPDGGATSSVTGTAELRIPFELPMLGDASMLFFGDWFFVQKDHATPFYAKSSIGIGLRKSVQGLPLKYDVSYTSEGNLKQFFGLGLDFDA
jgi:outer membrane protein assembly factor BamA